MHLASSTRLLGASQWLKPCATEKAAGRSLSLTYVPDAERVMGIPSERGPSRLPSGIFAFLLGPPPQRRPHLIPLRHPRLQHQHRVLQQLRQTHPMPLRHLAHLLGERATNRDGQHVGVRTRLRSARRVRPCRAFGGRLGLGLGLLLLAALSPRSGGHLGRFCRSSALVQTNDGLHPVSMATRFPPGALAP